MSLFQHTIVSNYITANADKISRAYKLYAAYFHNPAIQENIRNSKEEQFQEGFLRELFVKILGYTLNPAPDYNLITEQKNETNAKKADGAILVNGEVVGIIELKDSKATNLKNIETQAFGYKNYNKKAVYVITSNFEKLRFYIENAIDYEEFNLFTLSEEKFSALWLCLAYENIAKNLAKHLKTESVGKEEQITRQLYKDYSAFKRALFDDVCANNADETRGLNPLLLFKKTQKLLDRLLFILFAEDSGLLPPNSIMEIVKQWEQLKELDAYTPLYSRLKMYFGYMNTGRKGAKHDIFAYNGGLFAPDEVLNSIVISDEILLTHLKKVSNYDFSSEVDVNILGHIFENSLTEIEEITSALSYTDSNKGFKPLAVVSKRKKDGVFYTPRYITAYIVENTIGKLCTGKKAELEIDEQEYFTDKKRQSATRKKLNDKLENYRSWLLSLTICDPACGSGAFLNVALDFLMAEHKLIDEMLAKLTGSSIVFPNIENAILENNLYGVDINDESVEIAKLSLWLRTAKPNRKLNALNNNIKCGNSLISPMPTNKGINPLVNVEIEKAFDWHKEFPQVFTEKEKRAYHVTTAIHDSRTSQRMVDYKVREMRAKHNKGVNPVPYADPRFMTEEDEIIITKTIAEILEEDKLNVLAYNICGDHLHILLVCEAEELDKIVGKIKGKTARVCNLDKGINPLVQKENERSVPFWTQKFGSKEILDREQLYNTIEYIEKNKEKHELPINKGINPLVKEIVCDIDHAFRTEYKDGFDVVIGNPPYGVNFNEKEKEYLAKFDSLVPDFEIYIYFISLYSRILKENGLLSYIFPNTFLSTIFGKKYRESLFNEVSVYQIADLSNDNTFEDAAVRTCIFSFSKTKSEYHTNLYKLENKEFTLKSIYSKADILQEVENILSLFSQTSEEKNILEKLLLNPQLKSFFEVSQGLIPYDKYRGHDEFTIKNRIWHADFQKDETYRKELKGGDVNRYKLEWNGNLWISYGDWLAAPRDKKYFTKERVLVREITADKLFCVYTNEEFYNTPSIINIVDEKQILDLKYCLAILNSSLIGWLHNKISPKANKGLFPKILVNDVRNIPLVEISKENQQPFIALADKMLSLNSELQTKRQRFLKRLSDNFAGIKITGKIETFDELEFSQFVAELAKPNKGFKPLALSLKQQDEWEEYFNEYKTECRNFVNQINATDKEIDALVYELYGLAEEEVKVVEK